MFKIARNFAGDYGIYLSKDKILWYFSKSNAYINKKPEFKICKHIPINN